MASSNADLKTRISTLRHEILSYKPGKAVSCDDERVVFPDKLVVGMIDPLVVYNIVHSLRRVLHGNVKPSKHADKRQTSTEGQEEYLTDSISVITRTGLHIESIQTDVVRDLSGKVGCMVLLVHSTFISHYREWINQIKRITGHVPLCAIYHFGDTTSDINKLKQLGITDIYEVPDPDSIQSDEDQLQWLDLLHGCMKEGDRRFVTKCTNPGCRMLYEKAKKDAEEAKEANQKMVTEAKEQKQELEKGREEDRARAEKEKRSLTAQMTKELESKQQRLDTLTETVRAKERNETTLKHQVEELKKGREEDRTRAEKEKRSLAEDMTKKLESMQQRLDTLTETVREKERNETTLTHQVEELKKGREEDRARAEKEKRSLAADMTKKLESMQQRLDTLTETVRAKERNETTRRQQLEKLKKEYDYKEHLLEQQERENWKLRTKIQLESEIRSAEQKKKAETHKWNFIPWVTSGKQAQGDTSSWEDNSTGGLGRSDTLQAGEEPPDDEFAGILQQIADDLYEEAKIDSLAGQLGILHGDIQRALMTNMRFGRVTSDGTRHMLKQWRRGVSREDERIELKKALQAAKLVNLVDLYLSKGEQIDAEYANEDVNDQQLSNRDETSLEQTRTKGHTDIQVLQEATASSNHSLRDGHTGDMVSKTQEDLTDVTSGEVYPVDDMDNVSSIQPSEQLPSHEMQVLPEDVSEIAPLVSYGGKPNEESTTSGKSHVGGILSNEEDLVSQFVLIDTSPEKILLLFLVKVIMDVSQRALIL